MKVALLDARQGDRNPENSSTVAYRNMLVLKHFLGADMYISAAELRKAPSDYDAIICGFGSSSTEKEQSTAFLNRNQNARLYWLVGEYEQSTFAPLFYCKRKFHVLKNYEHEMRNKCASGQTFVNLNALLAGNAPSKPQKKRYGAIYYGRWRQDRLVYFARYLQDAAYLSTSPKNMKVFAAHGCNPRYARAMSWEAGRETLRLFSASLYIEDVYTHTHYNCPANRYYEAIKCGVPMLTQAEAMGTWDRYGLGIDDWRIVRNAAEMRSIAERLLRDSDFMASALDKQAQWGERAVAEKQSVLEQIQAVITK